MPTREPLTALDGIAIVIAIGAILGLASFVVVGPSFAAMYDDFGGPLPTFTRIALSPVTPLVLTLPPALALGLAWRTSSLATHRMAVVAAFALASLGIALCYAGAYFPLWQLAGSIQAE